MEIILLIIGITTYCSIIPKYKKDVVKITALMLIFINMVRINILGNCFLPETLLIVMWGSIFFMFSKRSH